MLGLLLGLSVHPGCLCEDSVDVVSLPQDMRIPVTVDGDKAVVINHDVLAGREPDFVQQDRRAWRLGSLVGDRYNPSLAVEVEDGDGQRHLVARPGQAGDAEAVVLAVNRTGEVRVALVAVKDPFPPFHGRGGNRGRRGDPSRVREVKRILISTSIATSAKSAGFQLGVVVEGGQPRSWAKAELDQVKPVELDAEDGEGERHAWPVRELVKSHVGAGYVLVEVSAEGGERLAISAEQYADMTRTPVLRENRQGLLKFMWIDAERRPTGEHELRAVRSIRLRRKNPVKQ